MSLALDNYVGLSENASKFHGLSSFSPLSHKNCHELGYVPVLDKPILQNPNLVLLNFDTGIVQELEIPLGGHT